LSNALLRGSMGPAQPLSESEERDRLPPLKPTSANGPLLQNLKQLQATSLLPARLRTPTSPDVRSLRTISTASRRANACVEELDAEMLASQSRNAKHRHAVTDKNNKSIVESLPTDAEVSQGLSGASKAFESMVAEIEGALHGNESNHRILRKGDVLSDRLPPRGVRHFKVPLPNRPTEVTITVSRNAASKPAAMWASTSCEKPHSSNYEIKGKDDKIVYKHVLSPSQHEEELANCVDRRHAVPSCRELYFMVEAQSTEIHFELTVSFQPLNVVLTRKELAGQLMKIRRSWEARIIELQNPIARAEFEEHITDLRRSKIENHKAQSGGRNFVKRNYRAVQDCNPMQNRIGLHMRALQSRARQDAASRRRNESTDSREELPALVAHTPVEAVQAPAI